MHTTEVILFFALRFSCMHGVVEFVSTLQKGLIVLCVWKRRGVTYWFHAGFRGSSFNLCVWLTYMYMYLSAVGQGIML
jgi:hypothetical protein